MRRASIRPAGKTGLLAALVLTLLTAAHANAKPLSEGGFLGVYTRELDIALLEAVNFDGDGVLIEDVVQGSPADEAEIEPGDILTTFEGRTMTSPRALRRALWKTEVGQKVELGLWRNGKARTVSVELAEDMTDNNNSMFWSFSEEGAPPLFFKQGKPLELDSLLKAGYLGVEMQTLGDQLAEYFDAGDNRAMVEEVKEDSPAEAAGLKAGDVFLKLDDKEVMDASDVTQIIREHKKGDELKITVLRKGKKKTLTATLDERNDVWWFGSRAGIYAGDMLDELNTRIHGGNRGLRFVTPETDGELQFFRRNNAQ